MISQLHHGTSSSSPTSSKPPTSPFPTSFPTIPHDNITFMQLNYNGFRNFHPEITNLLQSRSVMVSCLQDTKLSSFSSSHPPFFTTPLSVVTTPAHHVGVASSHSYTTPYLTPNPRPISSLATPSPNNSITSTINKILIHIHNIYIHSTSSCCPPSPDSFKPV